MSKRVWSKEETIQMVQMYEGFPELWNISHNHYKDRNKKNHCLTIISEAFNTTVDEVTRKIHNLRCQLNSEIRKIKKKCSRQGTEDCDCQSFFSSYRFSHHSISFFNFWLDEF